MGVPCVQDDTISLASSTGANSADASWSPSLHSVLHSEPETTCGSSDIPEASRRRRFSAPSIQAIFQNVTPLADEAPCEEKLREAKPSQSYDASEEEQQLNRYSSASDLSLLGEGDIIEAPLQMSKIRTEPLARKDGTKSMPVSVSHPGRYDDAIQSLKDRRGVNLNLKLAAGPASRTRGPEVRAARWNGERRGRTRHRSKHVSGGAGCSRPEQMQPKVHLLTVSSQLEDSGVAALRSPIPRPLPGSFPTRRTVFFFDWDDTLCPTMWIRSLLKGRLEHAQEWSEFSESVVDWLDEVPSWFSLPLPDDPAIQDLMTDIQGAVMDLIESAQAFGVVCIVTNAVRGWVDKTIKKWLPQLTPYISGHGARPQIKVIYGQQVYERPQGKAASLPWFDELGEVMLWKRTAMVKAIDAVNELYRLEDCGAAWPSTQEGALPSLSWMDSAEAKDVWNIISIGDSEAEMQSAELVGRSLRKSRGCKRLSGQLKRSASAGSRQTAHGDLVRDGTLSNCRPLVKLVKFTECPHVRQLYHQVQEAAALIPQLAALRRGIRVDLADVTSPLRSPVRGASRSPKMGHEVPMYQLDVTDLELRLGHSLMTQTV